MSAFHAIIAVEAAADQLGLRDAYGDPMLPPEALGVVSRYHGAEWESASEAMLRRHITHDEWAKRCVEMVEEYGRVHLRKRVEMTIMGLAQDQRELA